MGGILRTNEIIIPYLLLTDLLTPWSRKLPDKLTSTQLAKELLAFYGIISFITAFIGARHLSLS
jgi:hypothetical protein